MALSAKSLFGETPYRSKTHFLESLLADFPRRDFQVRMWDGTRWGAENPTFTLILKRPEVLRAMFVQPSELNLGEAYIYDDIDIEGDIEAAFELADYLLVPQGGRTKISNVEEQLAKLPLSTHSPSGIHLVGEQGLLHSRDRDRQAVTYHYDLPADFYALWLDRHMVYSCAYFVCSDEDLETAQERKLDYLCRKLRLQSGEHLLDIGCGWGALMVHAAAHYGVQAVGITLSVPQAELARQRLRQAGINDLCRVEVCDYRDIDHDHQYDKVASVGMFEHVGEALLPKYFSQAWKLLRPGGLFLNHGISYSATYHRRGPSFTDQYVFPDGELVPLNTTLRAAELSGFEVRDVENLREHYAMTLHHWVQRLEAHADEARRITNDMTYRIWRLYMAGSAHGFRSGRLNLFQTLLAKPLHGESGLPLTREYLYRTP
jgi:cyclopropane-fatty-acyl-phospholipid synthase